MKFYTVYSETDDRSRAIAISEELPLSECEIIVNNHLRKHKDGGTIFIEFEYDDSDDTI